MAWAGICGLGPVFKLAWAGFYGRWPVFVGRFFVDRFLWALVGFVSRFLWAWAGFCGLRPVFVGVGRFV